MPPSSRSQSAATTALRKVHCELFRVKFLREIPHWWILGRCPPPIYGLRNKTKNPVSKENPDSRLRASAFSDACTRIRARAERAHAILVMSTGPWRSTSWI